jgi:hypothetical protein
MRAFAYAELRARCPPLGGFFEDVDLPVRTRGTIDAEGAAGHRRVDEHGRADGGQEVSHDSSLWVPQKGFMRALSHFEAGSSITEVVVQSAASPSGAQAGARVTFEHGLPVLALCAEGGEQLLVAALLVGHALLDRLLPPRARIICTGLTMKKKTAAAMATN